MIDILCPRCGGRAEPAGHEDARAFFQCPTCDRVWAMRIFAGGDGERPSARPAPRVLVADDSPEMLELMSAWLEDEGCVVIAVGSGREALQASALNAPDVAFVDVVLPPPDGYQVCEMLTQRGGPVVVLMTGTPNPDSRRVAEVGGLLLLHKPFAREAVAEALDTALEYGRRGAAGRGG